jgi:molybdenum cofactor cytidylyltransferase
MPAEGQRHAIVLAAGAGRRFGGGKLLAPWQGEPLVLAAVRTALAAPVGRVTVVLGAGKEAVAEALSALPSARLKLVEAEHWRDGLSASLRAGIDSLPAEAESVVVFLGDMPAIPLDLAGELLDAIEAGAPAAVVVSPRGPAHPAAFARSQFDSLRELSGDRGARVLLEALGAAVARIKSDDPGVVFDIDLPADIEAPAGGG